jgi:hypothetical protein
MIYDECGAIVGGMITGRGKRSTEGKPTVVLLRPPQIAHDRTWDGTQGAPVGSLSYITVSVANYFII